MSADFNVAQLSAASQSSEWTQQTGAGISAPACASATIGMTCSNNQPQVTFNISGDDNYDGLETLYINYPNVIYSANTGAPAVHTIPAGVLANNTSYTYRLQDLFLDADNVPFTTPNCAIGTANINATLDGALWSGLLTYSYSGPISGTRTDSVPVTLPDVPAGAYTISYISGGPAGANFQNITPSATQTLGAGGIITFIFNFVSPPQTLSVSKTGAGSGTVTSNPAGISCGLVCSAQFSYNTSVTLTASPAAGSAFAGWSGGGCSGAGTCTVAMTRARNVTAIFDLLLPVDFTLNPPSTACNSVSLSWTASTYADAYRILKGAPRVDISPYQPYTALNFTDTAVSQNTTYQYQIEAYNGAGTNRSNERSVTTPYCPPTLSFSGSPTSIFEGQSTTLTWSTSFATSCTASGAWSGSKPTGIDKTESVVPLPPPSVTYNLQCSGPGGSTPVQPVTINITPLTLPNWREIIPR